ncbi:thiamine pyrophosphate-binding protein [Paracoccus sulfuroxidans]|uniref:Acetolactate synthase-1/2/3 large subunit n=1 Tax=Paracoccus sulfuroxidans TaxID=384678 RepID=A0A562NGP9_9RHOB|nr:thiamine pyrophosphate-binding protein [Paracoccus sulfuroxidans]TWI31250.1 acetolactate synthase-1/2/3 large subunit [Paracoccus sulfuroxidans]
MLDNTRQADGGTALVAWLKAAGTEHVFSVSGGPINPVYRACAELGVQLVHCRHEAAACYMAEARSRVTGKLGVAMVTLGPGVTNAATPAIVSHLGGTPLLIIGAQSSTAVTDRGAGMTYDVLPAMRAVTKWAARCTDPRRLQEYLDMAWRHIWAGRPGPVFLEVPTDILHAPVEEHYRDQLPAAPANPGLPGICAGDRAAFETLLAQSKRPVLLLGDDVFFNRSDRLQEAIEKHSIPFFTLRLARGAVDERHPLCAGPGYVPCNAALRRALEEADCVILVGHHFEFDLGFGDSIGKATKVVQIATDAAILHRNRRADIAFNTSAFHFLWVLAEAKAAPVDQTWAKGLVAEWRAEHAAQAGEDAAEGLHPINAIDAVTAVAPDDTIFVTSHGNVDFWADARIQVKAPGRYLRAGQSGTLGAELPYGPGARLADGKAPVIVFVGDGGVGFHATELDTAARYDAPFITVVLDDEMWAAISLPQEMTYGETWEMKLPRRDWAAVAEALGGKGYHASTAEEIGQAIKDAIASGKPAVVQVPVRSVISPYMKFIS